MRKGNLNGFNTIYFLLVIVLVGILAFYVNTNIEVKANEQLNYELNTELNSAKKQLEYFFDLHRRKLFFLSETPPISGLSRAAMNSGVDPLDGTSFQQWKNRLETIFIAKLKNQADIDQLRIIKADGKELIRVDRITGRIEAYSDNQLQDKSNTDYILKARDLSPHQYLISQFSLNREYGEIEYPYRPTLRYVTPIFNEDSTKFGFLVINVNPQNILTSLNSGISGNRFISILNDDGQIFWTKDEQLHFASELSPEIKWPVNVSQNDTEAKFTEHIWNNQKYYDLRVKIPLVSGKEETFIILTASVPESYKQELIVSSRWSTFGLMLFVLIIMSVIVAILMLQAKNRMEYLKSQLIFSAIINGSKDVIISLDDKGVISSWNDAATELFNQSSEKVKGQLFSQVIKNIEFPWLEKIKEVLNTGSPIQEEITFRAISEDRTYSMVLSPAKDKEGPIKNKLIGVAIILRDITDENIARTAIAKMNESLEIQINERTAELAKAHKEAVRASEVKSAFVSNISHEMRTPLNGIVGMINLVARESLSSKQQHYLQMAENSAETLATLVNDILDLSKIEAGKLEIDRKPFDLLGALENIVASMAVRAFDNSLELVLDISNLHHKTVSGDPLRFNQILFNLIGNAIKFTENGHVVVKVSSYSVDDDSIEFRCDVIDTGIGISKENHHKIFSKFDQESANTAQIYGGTGLGLAISKQLAELMNGDITFVSEKGKGSTFTLVLKYSKHSAQDLAGTPELTNKALLVVSPCAPICEAVQGMMFKLKGITTQHHLLDDALNSLIQDKKFDWIILDTALLNIEDWYKNWFAKANFQGKVALLKSSIYQSTMSDNDQLIVIDKPVSFTDFRNKLLGKASGRNSSSYTYNRGVNGHYVEQMKDVIDNIAGTKILAVDDNDINLEVAKGFLEPLDIVITTASNGLEAIEELKNAEKENAPYAMILMDCQMPEMDGYQASNAIRKGDAGKLAQNTPIIAMTASAMAGEREKCLAAGMTDYIIKPISLTVLTDMVTKYINESGVQFRVNRETQTPLPSTESAMANSQNSISQNSAGESSSDVWDIEAVMARLMNDVRLYDKLSDMFFDALPDRVHDLQSAIDSKDSQAIRTTSHRLRGIAGDVGAIRLKVACAELESAALEQKVTEYKTLFELLKDEIYAIEKSEKYANWQANLLNEL